MRQAQLAAMLLYRKVLLSRALTEKHRHDASLQAEQAGLARLAAELAAEQGAAHDTLASANLWAASLFHRVGQIEAVIEQAAHQVDLANLAVSKARVRVEIVHTLRDANREAEAAAEWQRDQLALQELISRAAFGQSGDASKRWGAAPDPARRRAPGPLT
jgi:hypothetical protein